MTNNKKAKITDENREESRLLKAIWEKTGHGGLNQAEFGDQFKIGSQAAVGFFLGGKSAISMKAAKGFAKGLNCSIGDFSARLAAEAEGIREAANPNQAESISTRPVGTPAELSVPLLSWVRAGDFCEAPGQFSMSDAEEFLPRPLFNTSKNTFALQVRGDSMDVPGGYREGEIVYIDPDVSPTAGRDVLAKMDTGMTLKRYKEDEDGPYLLQLNGNKMIRPAGNWHVCGVVVFSGQKR